MIKGRANGLPSYLSFKVGLAVNDFARVIQQHAWPPGMIVREFIQKTDNVATLPWLNPIQQQQQSTRLQNFY